MPPTKKLPKYFTWDDRHIIKSQRYSKYVDTDAFWRIPNRRDENRPPETTRCGLSTHAASELSRICSHIAVDPQTPATVFPVSVSVSGSAAVAVSVSVGSAPGSFNGYENISKVVNFDSAQMLSGAEKKSAANEPDYDAVVDAVLPKVGVPEAMGTHTVHYPDTADFAYVSIAAPNKESDLPTPKRPPKLFVPEYIDTNNDHIEECEIGALVDTDALRASNKSTQCLPRVGVKLCPKIHLSKGKLRIETDPHFGLSQYNLQSFDKNSPTPTWSELHVTTSHDPLSQNSSRAPSQTQSPVFSDAESADAPVATNFLKSLRPPSWDQSFIMHTSPIHTFTPMNSKMLYKDEDEDEDVEEKEFKIEEKKQNKEKEKKQKEIMAAPLLPPTDLYVPSACCFMSTHEMFILHKGKRNECFFHFSFLFCFFFV